MYPILKFGGHNNNNDDHNDDDDSMGGENIVSHRISFCADKKSFHIRRYQMWDGFGAFFGKDGCSNERQAVHGRRDVAKRI